MIRAIQPLQVTKDLQPQIEHHPLASQLHRPCLDELDHESAENRREVGAGHPRQAVQIAAGNIGIDRQLGQVRRHQLQQ